MPACKPKTNGNEEPPCVHAVPEFKCTTLLAELWAPSSISNQLGTIAEDIARRVHAVIAQALTWQNTKTKPALLVQGFLANAKRLFCRLSLKQVLSPGDVKPQSSTMAQELRAVEVPTK